MCEGVIALLMLMILIAVPIALYIMNRIIRLEKRRLRSILRYALGGVDFGNFRNVSMIAKGQYIVEQRLRTIPKYKNVCVLVEPATDELDDILYINVYKNIFVEVHDEIIKR